MQIDLTSKSNLRKNGKPRLAAVIRAKCLDCCAGQMLEVKECTVKGCPLWEYRLGRNTRKAVTQEAQNEEGTYEAQD